MKALEFKDVCFAYDDANAIDGMSLCVEEGEFVCIVGGNGSGKSTFAQLANALLVPSAGTVRVFGRDTADPRSTFPIRSDVGMVFQNPDDQIVASIVEDDVAFGPANLGVPKPELRDRVTRALAQVSLQGFEARAISSLSGGQKQRVAIAGALAMEPKILVLDEASSMLDPRGRKELLRTCRQLNASGLTIVHITHFMDEATDVDRVIVLEQGRIALDGAPRDVLGRVERLCELHLNAPFATLMSAKLQAYGVPVNAQVSTAALEDELRRLLPESSSESETPPATPLCAPPQATPSQSGNPDGTAPTLCLENVSFTYDNTSAIGKRGKRVRARNSRALFASADKPETADGHNSPHSWALRNVSLAFKRGEILGVAGCTGSGKSTLVQIAAGLMQPSAGTVTHGGCALPNESAACANNSHVGLVFQYPERQLFAATVYDDVAFGPRNLGLSPALVETRVRAALDAVDLNLDNLRDRSPFALSGGQQRCVAIAGVLAMEPQTLIMDEPTAGLDPQSRDHLLALIRDLRDANDLTIALVSHDMDDLARMCDRIAVLDAGELVAWGKPIDVFAKKAALEGLGLDVPQTIRLAHALGIEALGGIPSISSLARAIAQRLGARYSKS